ncbi:MAG: radical SAM protein [Kiritimatiellae bacterium]|nr:radical SAM protein [Kiritimatiellia bacterium]MDD5521884.1 radical SAM protein [Kiritimatiellia bacterium]
MTVSGSTLLVNLPITVVSTTPFFVMPPGLLALAAYLRKHDESVAILDLCVVRPWKADPNNPDGAALRAFEERLRSERSVFVGVSVMVAGQFRLAREVCKLTKKLMPGTITAVGGAHVSQFPHEILENCMEVDFVAMGEGEPQVLALARYSKTGTVPSSWPDGLAYRKADGEIVLSAKRSYIQDINTLPWPAYDLLRFEDYRHDTSTWHNPYKMDFGIRVPMITSRGCPFGCNFCSVSTCMGLRHRARRADRVADELQMLHEKYGVRYIAFFDANFAEDALRVISLCDEIRRRNLKILLDLPTGLPVRVAADDMIDALASAGLIRTCISVESGDTRIRNDVMGKNITEDDIFRMVAAVRRHPQIFLLTDFVLGMPEDTTESLEASCHLIDRLETDDIALSIATPYPGTKLYQQCVRDNLFLPDIDQSRLWEADWYTHANVNRFTIKPYKLDVDTLTTYRDRILALRVQKFSLYRNRMKDQFGVSF